MGLTWMEPPEGAEEGAFPVRSISDHFAPVGEIFWIWQNREHPENADGIDERGMKVISWVGMDDDGHFWEYV